MEKTIELCGPCAAKMADGYKMTRLSRPADLKINCALCGRRRFGAVYATSKKEAGA